MRIDVLLSVFLALIVWVYFRSNFPFGLRKMHVSRGRVRNNRSK